MPNRMQHLVKDALASLVKNEDVNNDVMKSALTAVRKEAIKQIDDIYTLAQSGKGEKALRRIRRFVEKSAPPEQPDWVSPSLDVTFEVLVYPLLMKEKIQGKRYFPAPVPMGLAYHLWGLILCSMGKEADAQKRFRQSLEWNPFTRVNYVYLNRYCEETKDYAGWLDNIRQEYHNALYVHNLSEAYAELGRYLMRQDKPAEAAVVIAHAKTLAGDDFKPEALDAEFEKELSAHADAKTDKTFGEICREYGLDEGPDAQVVSAITEAAGQQESNNGSEGAAAMYRQLHRLTGDASYADKADALEKGATHEH
jgi:tetratricopeptide (TPR) repeat protein